MLRLEEMEVRVCVVDVLSFSSPRPPSRSETEVLIKDVCFLFGMISIDLSQVFHCVCVCVFSQEEKADSCD